MCLKTLNLALKYNSKTKEYTGFGYKVLSSFVFNSSGKLDETTDKCKRKKWSKKWKRAVGWYYTKSLQENEEYANKKGKGIKDKQYYPGFHIFLTPEDAKSYNPTGVVVKVEYKNVLAFGTNDAGFQNGKRVSGPCVVAEYMRIVEVVTPGFSLQLLLTHARGVLE